MRRVLAAMAAGLALLSCETRQPTADQSAATMPMGVVEPSGPIARSPLSPPGGYASQPPLSNAPTPIVPYVSTTLALGLSVARSAPAIGRWRPAP